MSDVAVIDRTVREFVVEWGELGESSPLDDAVPADEDLAVAVTAARKRGKDRLEPSDAETLRLEWMAGEPSS
ncbi:MAG: hypothetical protein E6I26_08135 [Chloroflexi bacterium]|nr:MAG: hypothetical protein E6I26_08135 [Chloroflexota bacterium]